jgi:CheY-like chemotaxis protein
VKIIDDILDVSRIIAGKLRLEPMPVDLVTIAGEALEVVRPSATAKGITLELEASPRFCVLLGDPERLQQVVWNLLSNAVKFSERGGVIEVAIRSTESSAVLTVADQGCGIEPDFLPFVFDRFRQADASTTRRIGGLGLGLALVRHIVELHGGRAVAHSEGPGKGALFTIEIPLRRAIAPGVDRQLPSAPSSESHALDGVRVLIVDDDADSRDLMAEVLTQAGAVAEAAPSAAAGFDALSRFHPHVLISDIAMPDEDGYAFMQRVRAMPMPETAAIPSLALTAYARPEDRAKALAKGFTTHLGKPINPRDLIAAVASLAGFARPLT